jgi:hypothetical protein
MSLRRTSSSKKNVVWDEDNLRENEEIQKDYQHVRISEPKVCRVCLLCFVHVHAEHASSSSSSNPATCCTHHPHVHMHT